MSIRSVDQIEPALAAAARHGLPGVVPPDEVCSIDDWVMVTAAARRDHLSGFLADALDAGWVDVDPDGRVGVLQHWHEELHACVALEALLVRTAQILDDAGVEWRLTKGAAVAHLDYPDPAVRTFGDVDIIVRPGQLAKAVGGLVRHGYVRQFPPLRSDYDERFGKGATLTSPEAFELDLHRRLAVGRFGVRSDMEDLFGNDDLLELGGRQIPVLDGSCRLLHACFHASLGGFHYLRAFRDVAQLLLVTQVDWERTFDLARAWRAEPVVAAAIGSTWRVLGLGRLEHPAHRAAVAASAGRLDRWALDVFAREAPFRTQAFTALGRLPVRDVPRYLWSLALPRQRPDGPSTSGGG